VGGERLGCCDRDRDPVRTGSSPSGTRRGAPSRTSPTFILYPAEVTLPSTADVDNAPPVRVLATWRTGAAVVVPNAHALPENQVDE
jgi:hypothetical protein